MNQYKLEAKWALIFFAATLLWMLLERLAGLHDRYLNLHPYISSLFIIPAVLIYVLALRKKKVQLGGAATYKQLFISGLMMTLAITAIAPFTQYVVSYWITPDYFKNVIRYSVENGQMTQAEAENYFNYLSYVKQTVPFTFLAGVVTTALASLFIRSRK
jgi:hypothetical protein